MCWFCVLIETYIFHTHTHYLEKERRRKNTANLQKTHSIDNTHRRVSENERKKFITSLESEAMKGEERKEEEEDDVIERCFGKKVEISAFIIYDFPSH